MDTSKIGERTARLETKMDEISLGQAEISKKVDELKAIMQTHNLKELETHSLYDQKIDRLQSKVQDLEKTSGLWRWLAPTLAAIAGSVLTFLIIEYLKKR
jgi:hypothetical protein